MRALFREESRWTSASPRRCARARAPAAGRTSCGLSRSSSSARAASSRSAARSTATLSRAPSWDGRRHAQAARQGRRAPCDREGGGRRRHDLPPHAVERVAPAERAGTRAAARGRCSGRAEVLAQLTLASAHRSVVIRPEERAQHRRQVLDQGVARRYGCTSAGRWPRCTWINPQSETSAQTPSSSRNPH